MTALNKKNDLPHFFRQNGNGEDQKMIFPVSAHINLNRFG
jgi:hypothetical protein